MKHILILILLLLNVVGISNNIALKTIPKTDVISSISAKGNSKVTNYIAKLGKLEGSNDISKLFVAMEDASDKGKAISKLGKGGDVAKNLGKNADEFAGEIKPSLTAHKDALKKVKDIVGKQPKGKLGKFGAPQKGTPKKGYRLDPPHPNAKLGSPEAGYHFNYWDYTKGKRGLGGISGAIPIE